MQRYRKIWTDRRHLIHFLLTLLFCIGWVPLPGFPHGLVKIDFNAWQLHFFGIVLVPGLMHIFFLGIFLVMFSVAVTASLYGKVFCGWVCPQNIFFELSQGIHTALRKRFPYYRKRPRLQKFTDLGMALCAASTVTVVANCYFVGASPIFIGAMSLFLMTFITLDAHIWKHQFCKSACPYAFLQQSLNDTSSLHVAYENRPGNKCGICTACVKACYVDLDIKKDSFDIDCTLCGACVDACEQVYSRSPEPPLLVLQCGTDDYKAPFNFLGINSWRKVFIVGLFASFCCFFAWSIVMRPVVKFRIDYPLGGGRSSQMLPYIEDGVQTNQFTLRLKSLSSEDWSYLLLVDPGFEIQWEAERALDLAALSHLNMNFKLLWREAPANPPALTPVSFRLISQKSGEEMAVQELFFKTVRQ